MRVEQLLIDSAARHGHKAAIVAGRAAHSYVELDRKSDRLAAVFAARGVKRGDCISVFLKAGFPAVVTAFGILKAGATLCPIDATSDAEALGRALNERGATGIVTEARLALKAAAALCEAPGVKLVVLVSGDRAAAQGNCVSFEEAVGGLEGSVAMPAGSADDVAMVLGSMGSDGRNGLVSFSHADFLGALPPALNDNAEAMPASVGSYAGLCRLVAAIRAGATQIIDGRVLGRAPSLIGGDFRDVRLALS